MRIRNIVTGIFLFLFLSFNASSMAMSPAQAKEQRLKLINYTKQFIGCPYIRGAIGPDSFDCSGLLFTCSRESIGVQLPRQVKAIFSFCKKIEDWEREAGDLVFFKTTGDGSISHVGLYIGNNQFIHCASDGPNTGVIISSLKETYWKSHYAQSGRYLPVSEDKELASSKEEDGSIGVPGAASSSSTSASSHSEPTKNTFIKKNGSFFSKLEFEATLFVDWNFFTAKNVNMIFHGLDAKAGIRYTGFWPEPYIAADIDWEYATGIVRFPIEIGVAFNPYIRFYLGPVFSLGEAHPSSRQYHKDDDCELRPMIFPGIVGVEFSTPAIKTKYFKVTFVQDVRFNFYSELDGSNLSFINGLGNGLVFATGVRAIF